VAATTSLWLAYGAWYVSSHTIPRNNPQTGFTEILLFFHIEILHLRHYFNVCVWEPSGLNRGDGGLGYILVWKASGGIVEHPRVNNFVI